MPRHWAEEVARRHLERRGYRTLAQNYRLRQGELDLVMQDGKVLVFVEVKQRRSSRHGTPAEAISARKMKRLRHAALHYVVTHFGRDDLPMRFDAVLVLGEPSDFALEHLEAVF